jgi:type II secretory pathway pseudopilin PulG
MRNNAAHRNFAIRRMSRERGASLLEGIAYLGIAALVILGAVSLLSGAFGSAQANRANEQLLSLRTTVRKLYANQTYPAAIVPTLITARGVPSTLVVDTTNNTISNGWGGAVTIVGNAGASGANSFTITFNAVPQDACLSMLSGTTGWTQALVGTTSLTTFPITTAAAAGACAAGNNVVAFTAS